MRASSPADLLAGIRPDVTVVWLIVYPTAAGPALALMTDATAALNQASKLHGIRLPVVVPASALPEIPAESG